MSREMFQRLFQLIPNDDLLLIVKKTKVTPGGFTLRSLTLDKIVKNRSLFVNALLGKIKNVIQNIDQMITNDEQYKEIKSYRNKNKADLLQLAREGVNPFWLTIALLTCTENYDMGSLVFLSLESDGALEKYSIEAERLASEKKAADEAKQEKQDVDNEKKQEDKKSEALERKITKLEEKVKAQEVTITDQSRRLKTATAQITDLESYVKKSESKAEELNDENATLHKRLEAKDAQLKQQGTNHNNAINTYKTKVTNLEKTNISMQKRIDELTNLLKQSELRISNLIAATETKGGKEPMTYAVSEVLAGVQMTINDTLQEKKKEPEKQDQELSLIVAVVGANTRLNNLAVKDAGFPVRFYTAYEALDMNSADDISELWVLSMDVPQDIVREIKLRYQNKFVLLADLVELKERIKVRDNHQRRRV